ncbi:hypothetical protein [Spirillospora sp. CA-128828]
MAAQISGCCGAPVKATMTSVRCSKCERRITPLRLIDAPGR